MMKQAVVIWPCQIFRYIVEDGQEDPVHPLASMVLTLMEKVERKTWRLPRLSAGKLEAASSQLSGRGRVST
jgi:hypothetical protein